MEKQYTLGGFPVHVALKEGLVHIVNDGRFRQALVGRSERTTSILVALIKADHEVTFGRDLDIGDDSFAVEIWGHLYADYLLRKYSRLLRHVLVFGLYGRFRRSCEVIDCGERGKDPNRWLWNILMPFRKMLARRLDNIPLSRFTEG